MPDFREDWRTCMAQEYSYTAGWRNRMCNRLKPDGASRHYWRGYNDADHRLRCPKMYADWSRDRR